MIQISVPSLITLCAAVGIVMSGITAAVCMCDCHHPDAPPPPLKEN